MNKNKKIALILIIVLLLTALVGAYYYLSDRSSGIKNDENASQEETINFNPPTEDEKQQADSKKEELVEENQQEEPPQQPNDSKKQVEPIITSAGQYGEQIEVRAFIPNIYEANGTCTVVFTKNNNRIERQVEGIQDATTTRCDTVTILRQDFPSSGTWTVKVTYSSPSSQGESDASNIEIN